MASNVLLGTALKEQTAVVVELLQTQQIPNNLALKTYVDNQINTVESGVNTTVNNAVATISQKGSGTTLTESSNILVIGSYTNPGSNYLVEFNVFSATPGLGTTYAWKFQAIVQNEIGSLGLLYYNQVPLWKPDDQWDIAIQTSGTQLQLAVQGQNAPRVDWAWHIISTLEIPTMG